MVEIIDHYAPPPKGIVDHYAPASHSARSVSEGDTPGFTTGQDSGAEPPWDYTQADLAAWKQSRAADTSVPFIDGPGVTRGAILPFLKDESGLHLAMPGFLAQPIRGVVKGAQEMLGERPVGDPRAAEDVLAAAMLGVTPSPAPLVTSVAAKQEAFRPLYEFVSRVTGEDISSNPGALRVVKRLEQDRKAGGPTAQDMIDLLNSAPDAPQTLLDVAGKNVRGLAGKVARAPGPSGQVIEGALNERDLGAGNRLSASVNAGLGEGSAYDAAVTLHDLRKTAAAPAYEAAYAHPPINPDLLKPEGAIGALMPRPSMRAGMSNALRIAAEEGRDPSVLGIDLDAQGEPFFTRVPNWQTLDYVKRGLDDVVEKYRDTTTGRLVLNTYGNAANDTRALFRTTLRDLNPSYAKALDSYSGPSTSIDALRAGQGFLHQRPEEIARRIKEFGEGDREFYKMGAADTLRIAVAKKGVHADETKAVLNSQYMRDQLRPLFETDEAFSTFIKSIEAEGRMFNSRYDVLGNSRSAARLVEDATPELDALEHGVKAGMYAHAGFMPGALSRTWEAIRSLQARGDPAINEQIARILTAPLSEEGAAGRLRELRKILDAAKDAPPPGPRVSTYRKTGPLAPQLLRGLYPSSPAAAIHPPP